MSILHDVTADARPTAKVIEFRERRRAPRIDVFGQVEAHLLPVEAPVDVINVGFDGFSIEASFVLENGSSHEFRFTLPDDSTAEVRARVVHARTRLSPAGAPVFVMGMEFDRKQRPGHTAPAELVNAIAAAMPTDVA